MSRISSIFAFIKRNKWRLLIAAVIILPVAGLAMVALSPKQPEYVTAVSEKQDLKQTVEAVGTVISERDLQLQFASMGIVAQVYVKEGDIVKAGQRLAALRAGNLSAMVASAAAQVQAAEADLKALEEGSRPEDIAISEAEVASKRASLESAKTDLANAEKVLNESQNKLDALKQEALTSLFGTVTNVGSTVTKELTAVQNAISSVRDVFSNNDIVDAIVKYGSYEQTSINASLSATSSAITALYRDANPQDYEKALLLLTNVRKVVTDALTGVNRTFDLISVLPESSSFSETDRQAYKADLVAERNVLQTSLNTLDAESKSLRDASANFSTRISTEEASVVASQNAMDRAKSDIATFEASLRISEAQLQLKRAPVRSTDLAAAQANVRQMRASLARASADYSDTILTAPIEGRVTKVHVKAGEYTPTGAAITMLGNSPFRVEMYVSEIDVPKIQMTQTGSVELDAFRGTNFALRVSEVGTAATDRDGVPKYRVRLDFVYPHDELKIGMTGDASIVTGMQPGVVTVPLRAVLEKDDGTSYVRIMREDGTIEERDVETGLEGEGGDVEVSGVQEGETVIVLEKL